MITLCQRDPAWANVKLGASQLTVGRYGCTTCAVSMLSDYFKGYLEPQQLAANVNNYTPEGLILWSHLKFPTMQFVNRQYLYNDAEITKALKDPNLAVIIEVNHSHWVAGVKKDLFGRIIVNDPWLGDKCDVKKRYGQITGSAIFMRKS